MSHKTLLALGLCVGFALPAAAQQTPAAPAAPASGQQPSASKNESGMAIQAKLTQDLGKAGFTNVEVMPESFLVRAKDKDGRAVMMVINPDSITSVTAMNQPANGQSGGQSSAPAGASPAKK